MTDGKTLPDHARCDTHRGYKLSCDQYERLLARSGQLCEICRKSVAHTQCQKLHIDHCGPKWAVRGLLCTHCNTRLRDGHGWFEGSGEYLAKTWWVQECARLGIPTQLGPEPCIGSAVRDQHGVTWIRLGDSQWHSEGKSGKSYLTWKGLYDMRGPQNMAPFDVYGPEGTDRLRWAVEKALGSVTEAQAKGREDAAFERGRLAFARELLGEMTDEESDYFLKEADLSEWQPENDPPQTDTDLACSAVSAALNAIRCDWDYLARRIEDTLRSLPDGIGERALAAGEQYPRMAGSPYGQRTFMLTDALHVADDLLGLPAAEKLLATMPEDKQSEWRAFARALYHRADLDDDRLTSRAGHCAKIVLSGRNWDDMCWLSGDAIPACPRRATHYARITELECCGPDGPEGHKGHKVCDRHLKELVDGTHVSPRGKTCSTTEYVAAGSPPWDF